MEIFLLLGKNKFRGLKPGNCRGILNPPLCSPASSVRGVTLNKQVKSSCSDLFVQRGISCLEEATTNHSQLNCDSLNFGVML
jgi:hypothetical protein